MSLQKQDKQAFEARLRQWVGMETGPAEVGPDPVNEAMIRHWCEAMGDRNPVYADPDAAAKSVHGGLVAPPTMLQAWIMHGLEMAQSDGEASNEQLRLHQFLTEHGYASVVATDCEQEYRRYLRPGDRISATTVIESISEEKATALGIGYFVDTRTVFRDQHGEEVGAMKFRVLKFKPAQEPRPAAEAAAPAKPRRLAAPRGHDNAWWWEGIDRGEILIQRCTGCRTLRHPPRPMCGRCQSLEWDAVPTTGRGSVYSYTVVHHPQFPGYVYPIVVALVELEEGTRIVANVEGCEPEKLHVGMPVEGRVEEVDEGLKLPVFRPAA